MSYNIRAETAVMLLLWSTAAVALVCPATTARNPPKVSRLAKYIPNLCKRSNPQLNKCVKKIIMKDLMKFAKTGIPELNVPAFEPIVIEEYNIKSFQGISSSFFGINIFKSNKHKAFVHNLKLHHSSEFIINDLKIDIGKNELYIDLSFPHLEVNGEYDFNLMMFGKPFKSKGPLFLNLIDYSIKATLYGNTVKRKDVNYFLFDKIDIKLDHRDYSLVFQKMNSFYGIVLNGLIKKYKDELKKLAMPINEDILGKLILKTSNKILNGLPVNDLFPC